MIKKIRKKINEGLINKAFPYQPGYPVPRDLSPEKDNIRPPDFVNILDPVLVIGHPYGLDYTVTTGRINNILQKEMRDYRGRMTMFTLLQTDATVNPGNSGGPLISALGEVIGVCSASYADARSEGLHFFVPINEAYDILP